MFLTILSHFRYVRISSLFDDVREFVLCWTGHTIYCKGGFILEETHSFLAAVLEIRMQMRLQTRKPGVGKEQRGCRVACMGHGKEVQYLAVICDEFEHVGIRRR